MNSLLHKRDRSNGLILLIVLGMLGLFTLLAVTYVVSAGASRNASDSMRVRARNSNVTVSGSANAVVNGLIRGTNDVASPFYRAGNFLEDVWGPNPIRTRFGHASVGLPFQADWGRLLTTSTAATPTKLAKVSLLPVNSLTNTALSGNENEYNSRVLTVLEGPLAGQSFRILKYVGYVRGPAAANPDDTNLALRNSTITANQVVLPWAKPDYTDADYYKFDYSVMLDLNDVWNETVTGQYYDSAASRVRTVTLPVRDWVANLGVSSLFYYFKDATNYQGYSTLINDAAFNNAGIGLNDRDIVPGLGTLDAREMMAIPSNASIPKIPPALLTHYDYLQDPTIMSATVSGIGNKKRSSIGEALLNGASNEGYDVPGWQDPFLAFQNFAGSTPHIIPSFHRPEVINYIANLFGDPANLTQTDVAELLKLVDASSSRVMSYRFGSVAGKNPGFRSNDPSTPRLTLMSWSNPPTPAEISDLQSFIAMQINGPWDMDNDGDGYMDSVLIDPRLPTVYSPDGKLLRPLVTILAEDLDSRVNVNTAGDRTQGLTTFFAGAFDTVFKPKATNLGQHNIPQGMGVGPADISLTSLFGNTPELLRTAPGFSFFDDRYGARRYKHRPIDLMDGSLDRVPGKRVSSGGPANDIASQVFEREIHVPFSHGRLPGLPMARRSSFGMDIDRHGNLAMMQVMGADADPYNPALNTAMPSEIDDDPYDARVTLLSNSDDLFALDELQTILLRYQSDASSMPQRLRERLKQIPGYSNASAINKFITTRSAELRYPNLVAAARVTAPFDSNRVSVESQAPSMLNWIKLLHAQRYQTRTLPTPVASDDPDLTYRAIEELFPADFAKGLRMDLNRPFGNGFDSDGDGQVDEPEEILNGSEYEFFADENGNLINAPSAPFGAYRRDIQESMGAQTAGTRIRLGSRQILARHLYCLGQLIIPRDFLFPGMPNKTVNMTNAKIRAAAIAQWAVNVVDFRDADAAMTRFEYDIFPFGCGTMNGLTARPAYWAPDHLNEDVNGVANKTYTGVVWGMEMPELLLTESLATHDTRNRDTDFDPAGKLYDPTDSNKDQDTDQYRFPLASLFLELYCPRTTNTVNSTDAASNLSSNTFIPGAPSSLYTTDAQNQVALDLARRAPANGVWGQQPVWRIAITEFDATNNPNKSLKAGSLANITHQSSTSAAIDGVSWTLPPAAALSPDAVTGNGLHYDLSNTSTQPPVAFDRFIWFSGVGPTNGQSIPDLKSTLASNARHTVYYNRTNPNPLLTGGSYMVVGPRTETPMGSATHNQFTNTMWDPILKRGDMSTPTMKPIYSPSFQRISLATGTVSTKMINDTEVNAPWMTRIKTPLSLVCATEPPDDPALGAGADWDVCFPDGVGMNISFPTPAFGSSIWSAQYRPTSRLNSTDLRSSRSDMTFGFGDTQTPPDSWIDVGPAVATGTLPQHPFDRKEDPSGPNILNTEIRKLGRDDPDGTYENIRAAYLQRLADPELAYDPISNPYITVDWISLDLTVFNGEGASNSAGPPPTFKFQSRYKDGKYAQGSFTSEDGSVNGFSYYSPSTPDLVNTIAQPDPPTLKHRSYFKHQLGYRTAVAWAGNLGNCGTTLGHLNAGFPLGASPRFTAVQMAETSGALANLLDGFGPPVTQTLDATNTLVNLSATFWGSPRNISAVQWFNRPFATPNELMLVPATGPGQFGFYHSAYSGTQRKPYSFLPSFQTSNPASVNEPSGMEPPTRTYWMTQSSAAEADFALMMDLVEAQTPYADANKVLRPDLMYGFVTTGDRVAQRFLSSYVPAGSYGTNLDQSRGPTVLAPFNLMPSYIAAGKINVNTVVQDTAGFIAPLKAVDDNYKTPAQRIAPQDATYKSWQDKFVNARRGYPLPAPANKFFVGYSGTIDTSLHADYPTQFAGAFRPSMSANIAPFVPNDEARARIRGKYGIETTLMRSDNPLSYTAVGAINDQAMLFSPDDIATGGNRVNQNAFTRMQRVMRAPNLVTNQSNVFAVWVTVSLYEYDPINGFGNEFLDETGQPKREKYFYIIDRSIPVGFTPGENLNTDKTILLKRKLD
jgi:hypothetical protein